MPELLGLLAVGWIGDDHVGGQAMGEGTDLAGRSARRGLTGERKGARARHGDLARQQVEHVDLLVDPRTSRVLVESHRPEGEHLALGVRVELGELVELLLRDARELAHVLGRVGSQLLLELLEGDGPVGAGLPSHRLSLLAGMVVRQAVTDVDGPRGEDAVLVDEIPVDRVLLDHGASNEVHDREVRLGLEDHLEVGEVAAAVGVGREVHDLRLRVGELPIGDPGPQNGMTLRHVGAPADHGIGDLDVVVAAGRLVDPEGLDEARHGGRHAVARVGVEVVGAHAGLHELRRGVALIDRVLAGAEDGDRRRSILRVVLLELLRHHVEGRVPAHGRETALLVVLAVLHPQQRPREAILPVHDGGVEVALDAVETAVDR
jgi:hypothetical protein